MNIVAPNLGEKRVLIVDDDQDFSTAIGEILETEHYVFRQAHSAQDACETAAAFDAQVALLDIRLGRDNGIELIERLKAVRPGILCVMMTGHAALDTAIQALQYGAYNYLRKPIDGLDLLSTLERCFEKIGLEEEKRLAETVLGERNAELITLSVRLRGVVEATRRLASVHGLEALLPVLHDEVRTVVGGEHAALYLRRGVQFVKVLGDGSFPVPAEVSYTALRDSCLHSLLEAYSPVLINSDAASHLPEGWATGEPISLLFLPFFGDASNLAGFAALGRDAAAPFHSQDKDLGLLLVSVCSDILRGAEASEALSKSEQRYRLLADNVADIIWTVDISGHLTFVSPSVQSVCGVSPDDLTGQPLESRMTPESAAAVRRLLEQVRDNPNAFTPEAAQNLEIELLRADDIPITTETKCIALREKEGPPTGLLAVSRDISQRKRAEEARSRLAAAVEHAAESIMITDPNGAIQYVNPAFVKLMGYTQEETLGKTPRLLRSGKMEPSVYERLWETLSAGKVWQGRFVNRTKSGQLLEQEATISAIRDGRGAIINYVSVARDVTHEVELETQLRQAQKLEAIGTLAGGIAHDFNNMLSPILGYAELALMSVQEEGQVRHSLQEIHSAGKRASELVKQILAFSRHSEQEQRRVHMDSVVGECMQLLRGSLPSTISIRLNLDECPPIMADPTQMHQVIMNLSTNAYHAMREHGGVLTVGLKKAVISTASPPVGVEMPAGEYVQLTITDTGQGMTEDTLERIFEPYFTTKRVGEGTGLGLATVHGIVQGHGGYVAVFSRLSEGTTFDVYLPAAQRPPAAPTAELLAIERTSQGERILIVDDEPAIVSMMTRGLEARGYHVEGFTDSALALKAFEDSPEDFDMILTDQTMPKVTGLELARRALKIRPELPVILTTGYSDSVNEHVARQVGVRDFLFKPASPKVIAEHIHRIFKGSSA